MRSWLCDGSETVDDPSPAVVAERVAAGTRFWLDIEDPTDEVIDRLADRLGLHPLATLGRPLRRLPGRRWPT